MKKISLRIFITFLWSIAFLYAEGSYDTGLNQPIYEYNSSVDSPASGIEQYGERPFYVDILNASEVLNIHVCGGSQSDDIDIEIWSEDGLTQIGSTYSISLDDTSEAGHVSCTDNFNGNLTNPYQVLGLGVGTYQVRFMNVTDDTNALRRFNIAVNSGSTTINPRAKEGRVWAYRMAFNAGGYSLAESSDANFTIVVDGGFQDSYYLWLLDLDDLAGFQMEIVANNLGPNSPNLNGEVVAGMSTCMGTLNANNTCNNTLVGGESVNRVEPLFKMYLNDPEKSYPRPTTLPVVTQFSFLDNQNEDNTISPGTTNGIQDDGNFSFVTNLESNGTYELILDTDGNGIFGSGDVYLRGIAVGGFNQLQWNGEDNQGNPLPVGNYPAIISVKVGEYHFSIIDAETSGGTADNTSDGLTIREVLDDGTILSSNKVYWDDQTARNLNSFNLDGIVNGHHEWGTFSGTGDGNLAIMDTFVYGDSVEVVQNAIVVVANNDNPLDMKITKTSLLEHTPIEVGDTISYTVTVENNASTIINNIVVNDYLPVGVSYLNGSAQKSYPEKNVTLVSQNNENNSSLAIPDNQCPTETLYTINVSNSFTITDVNVGINLTHSWKGDMRIWVTSPQGTKVNLVDRLGGSNNNYDVLFDSDSSNVNSTLSGTHVTASPFYDNVGEPNEALTAFNNQDAQGDWIISFCDAAGADIGTLNRARIDFTGSISNGTTIVTNSANAPTNLVSDDDNITLDINETLTITYQVVVDSSLNSTILDMNNTATASSDEIAFREVTISDEVKRQIIGVTPATIEEGGTLLHTITLNSSSSYAQTYNFLIDNNTTANGDYATTYIFSNGVTYNAGNNTITVPAGVTSFTVTVSSTDDSTDEDSEFYDLSIGGVEATGTILDNDNLDYGDLPSNYNVTLANDGARHNILATNNPYLGDTPPDTESDGVVSDNGDADDIVGVDDEDGILFLDPMVAGANSEVNVTASSACDSVTCYISIWIDFNEDGDFDEANEKILTNNATVVAGKTTFSYSVPAGTNVNSPMFMMARITTQSDIANSGLAPDGEVETSKITSPSTLPVTISYVYARKYDNHLEIDFTTSTETLNIGFNIYAIKGKKWIKLNDRLINGAMDSLEPIDYAVNLDIPSTLQFKKIGIVGVDINNIQERHGGFKINREYGEKSAFIKPNWKKINQAFKENRKKRKKAKGIRLAKSKTLQKEVKALFKDKVIHMGVNRDGIYRVTHEDLLLSDINLTGVKSKKIAVKFRNEGISRAIYHLDNQNRWTKESFIEFKAKAPKGSDALYLDTYNYQLALFVNQKFVKSVQKIEPLTGKKIVFETNNKYSFTIPGEDPFYDRIFYTRGEGKPGVLTQEILLDTIPSVDMNLTASVSGYSDLVHHLTLSLNGEEIASVRQSGYKQLMIGAMVQSSMFMEGVNQLTITAYGEADNMDLFYYDKAIVSYDDKVENEILTPTISVNEKLTKNALKIKKGTNYLIVSHPMFIGDVLDNYVAQKISEGWTIQVVDVEDIYKAYDYDMATPQAIKRYLDDAKKRGVTHVQLVGSASYDYLNKLGLDSISFIPSIYVPTASIIHYTPCDGCMVANKKGIPKMAIGRWAVRSVEELESVINKTLAWSNRASEDKMSALCIADKKEEGGDFAKQMNNLANIFENTNEWESTTRVYMDDALADSNGDFSEAITSARTKIIDSLNNGVGIVSFSGHSAPTVWSFKSLLTYKDAININNQGQTALALPLACYTNYADSPSINTMAHQFLSKDENGFVAVYGASTLSKFLENGVAINRVAHYLLKGKTIGQAIKRTKQKLGKGYYDIIRNSNLLGDVTLKLK